MSPGATFPQRRWAAPAETVGCSGVTAWRRLRDWTEAGVWPRLHAALLADLRRAGLLNLDDCSAGGALSRWWVPGPLVAKRTVISARWSVAVIRWRRGRKWGEVPLNADRNRCAAPAERKPFIARSRRRVGWWLFSARLLRYFDRRCSTQGMTSRWAAP
ncbi:hypothetical protein GCM10010398_68380 [Streptomyces fimbriatus]